MRRIISTILIAMLLFTTAAYALPETIVNKQLIESEYGWLGDKLGYGDRLYIVTYEDGTNEEVFERTTNALAKATIVEGGSGTIWMSEGSNVPVNIRIQGLNLPTFCGTNCGAGATTHHRYEIFDNGVYRSIGLWEFNAPIPSVLNSNPSVPVTLTVPGESAGTRNFAIKECVQTADKSRYICGAESRSSDKYFSVIWTQAPQAGAPTAVGTVAPTSTPTNPNYVPPKPPVYLQVDSEPSEADVHVGSATVGKTPLLLTIYPDEGIKILYVMKSGYKTATKTVSATTTNPYLITLEQGASDPTPTATATPAASATETAGAATATATALPSQTSDSGDGADSESGAGTGTGDEEESLLDNPLVLWGGIGFVVLVAVILYMKPSDSKKTGKGKKK